jgi:hypothetical protein
VLILGEAERFSNGKKLSSYFGACALGGIQRGAATTGAHQQARQRTAALSSRGSSTSCGAKRCRLATTVPALGDASPTTDRQGSDGAQLAVRLFWMWRSECDYAQVQKFGSHAGQPG